MPSRLPRGLFALLVPALLCVSRFALASLDGSGLPSDVAPVAYTADFTPGADHDPAIPDPADLLGGPVGETPASGEQIVAIFRAIAAASPRVALFECGASHEGRPLVFAAVGQPERIARIESVRRDHQRLAAPGDWSASEIQAEIGAGPVVVWIGCSVHGNEGSGADAALSLLHHLAADRGEETRRILENTIVLIDPDQNPDGRARFRSNLATWSARVPDTDSQSLLHRVPWPSPRGNHYFLDLNRDWFAISQPETRARVRVLLDWHPQATFDLHEMGPYDSYLFAPPREPYHPELPASTHKWWARFAEGIANDFGGHGWSCYTGDWNEEFNPNRGAAWPLYTGAVALLAEQASPRGASVLRPDGAILTHREAVHHQFTAAFALIRGAAVGREEILRDYAAARRAQHHAKGQEVGAYVIDPSVRPDMALKLARTLTELGVTVGRTKETFRAASARNYWGEERGAAEFPVGSYVVDLGSGESRLARAVLDFDPPLGDRFLTEERRSLEIGKGSLLYESPAWSLAMSYGAEVYASAKPVQAQTSPDLAPRRPQLADRSVAQYGYLLDASAPGSQDALVRIHGAGIRAWATRRSFEVGRHSYPCGSLLVKVADNGDDLADRLAEIAGATGVRFAQVDHALVDVGEDMGSGHFALLAAPRVALLGGNPFFQTTFGALWHYIDQDLGLRCSKLLAGSVDGMELERYNVIVVPTADDGQGPRIEAELGAGGVAALRDWVRRGGTLITVGEANWLLYGGDTPLGGLRRQRDVLLDLAGYQEESARRREQGLLRVDELALRRQEPNAISGGAADDALIPPVPLDEKEDEWLRRFSPQGVLLRVDLDSGHWLAAGAGERVPVIVNGDVVLQARRPVEIVGSFAQPENLRLSGPLWPEARERVAGSVYLAREGIGKGQAISFYANPIYRAYFHGTGRLLANAILLGPGMGARVPAGW